MAIVFAYITTRDRDEARSLGTFLVENRLAACVNILDGMESIYHWEGKLERAREAVLIAKTDAKLQERLTAEVKARHSYDCPCVLFFDVRPGNPEYHAWLVESVEG